jgi:hypothetical protein
MVGVLPTLAPDDLQLAALSDAPRYRALNHGLRRLRQPARRLTASERACRCGGSVAAHP